MEIPQGGNRYLVKCKYCLNEFSGKPERLQHYVNQCSDWPTSEKMVYFRKISEESPATRKRVHDENNNTFTSNEHEST
ncbi:2997_t:CDS:2 [Scutellospora calospora]|uniref:2997_t:CDS:1 n=1 Tax=Scutellospora calospora TaxID=85575 RepID=A0ACA9K0J0_9GLOM|nr:2997_t:CDS:2 [Scutellospora calospora]